ncbi:unnamed protein product [Adineta ricciae]|uniref:Reverse transcriptase domain-containing protein n=1 Tax=Adineta ricciae TaxID=249248 RepID=A0A814MRK6_ADIRI|nr:unnamed protein product [Adineta ricciae]
MEEVAVRTRQSLAELKQEITTRYSETKQQTDQLENNLMNMEQKFADFSMKTITMLQNVCTTLLDPQGSQSNKWKAHWQEQPSKQSQTESQGKVLLDMACKSLTQGESYLLAEILIEWHAFVFISDLPQKWKITYILTWGEVVLLARTYCADVICLGEVGQVDFKLLGATYTDFNYFCQPGENAHSGVLFPVSKTWKWNDLSASTTNRCMIMGDFNIDLEQDGDKAKEIFEWMDNCSLGPVIPNTNTSLRLDRMIDYAIAAEIDLTVQTYEGFTTSDHKPLLLVCTGDVVENVEGSRTRSSIPPDLVSLLATSRSLSFKAKQKGDVRLREEAHRIRNIARHQLKEHLERRNLATEISMVFWNQTRPISLLDSFLEVYERLFLNRFLTVLNDKGILPDNQSGFRANYRFQTRLLLLIEQLESYMSNSAPVTTVLVDFKSAFDQLWGGPQGSSVTPTLFITYHSDIAQFLPRAMCFFFADDLAAVLADHMGVKFGLQCIDLERRLHTFFEQLEFYSILAVQTINYAKTQAMFSVRAVKYPDSMPKLQCGGHPIEWSKSFK